MPYCTIPRLDQQFGISKRYLTKRTKSHEIITGPMDLLTGSSLFLLAMFQMSKCSALEFRCSLLRGASASIKLRQQPCRAWMNSNTRPVRRHFARSSFLFAPKEIYHNTPVDIAKY